MKEIWKGVIYQGIDYSWRLEVSNFGKIRNAKTKYIHKQTLHHSGYYQICISLGSVGNVKAFRIHRCVAETFIENIYNEDMVVNHINGVKTDNFVNNLEIVTQAENLSHAIRTGLRKVHGVENPSSKLSISDIEFIIKNYKSSDKEFGEKALGIKFGVHASTILRLIKGNTYVAEVSIIKNSIKN